MILTKIISYFRVRRERKHRYTLLRGIRQERDYTIGKLQYANRPYTFPTLSPNGVRKVVTTRRFIQELWDRGVRF